MKTKSAILFILAVCALCLSIPAFAHHGGAAYDTSKTVTVKGTVTEFDFINPHVLIYMNVRDANGNVTKWSGELTSPNHLARAGWTRETLKPGETVTMAGNPTKNGDPIMAIRKLYSADGQEISTQEN
jgi:Family of unknown function (DUF6152)